jgi:predicted  nucleic acid-binding Zn-ribbon protein
MLFRNFYRCARCGHLWTGVWSATCDDDCPHCGARHMSPYKSEDVEEASSVLDVLSASDGDGGNHVEER